MQRPTFIYVFDTLCGWCYGMSPVIQRLYAEQRQKLDFVVLSGGMIRGANVKPIAGMADYIRQVAPRLEQVTGVALTPTYREQILDKGTYLSNSEPPAIALCILKEQLPEQQVPLAGAIQKLHFEAGRDLNEAETYLPVVAQFGADEQDFLRKFADPAYAQKAQEEFATVAGWGINGFPAVYQQNEQLYLLARGYQPYEQLLQTLEQVQQS